MIIPLTRKQKYFVSFFYTKQKRDGSTHRKNTQCFIKKFDPAVKGSEMEVLAKGFAKLSKFDQFNKKAGRKIAFTRALFNLFPSQFSTRKTLTVEEAQANRDNRAKFWKKFLSEITI